MHTAGRQDRVLAAPRLLDESVYPSRSVEVSRIMSRLFSFLTLVVGWMTVLVLSHPSGAFVVTPTTSRCHSTSRTILPAARKKSKEDLSYLETRDMTRDEMKALNAENEKVMNSELVGMTIFSLIISIPMLYLVWVGFFSETAGVDIDTF